MTTKESYEKMGASYENVLGRLGSEKMVNMFAKKFLKDGSFESLKAAIANKDAGEAFRAAHTLKGVCLNLGFDNLFTVSSDLTEKLRGGVFDGAEELFTKVAEQYNVTIAAISEME